jgi:hypothetical protein
LEKLGDIKFLQERNNTLGAAPSRWIHIVALRKPLMTQWPCGSVHERDSTRHGSIRFSVAQQCHDDESFKQSNSQPLPAKGAL